jgi:hypothetical protein
MAGNTHNTKVDLITDQVDNLLRHLESRNDTDTDALQRKYKHLFKTSPTLFNFIVKNYNTPKFDKEHFDKTLNLMLGSIRQIQDNNTSVHNASVLVGQHLAESFIPQLKKEGKN